MRLSKRPGILDLSQQADARAFYDSPAWRKLRARHRRRFPRCEMAGCGKPGALVDHIKPRRLHPELALDPANLQTLCRDCHDQAKRHHEALAGHPLAGGVDSGGWPISPRHPWLGGAPGQIPAPGRPDLPAPGRIAPTVKKTALAFESRFRRSATMKP